mmetsp:Transcript_47536/g.99449  ORF Transcript_47536/g.99449 Transcript_47536/m.99449 type:complete len:84 (+) Transcript_47536:205-456(+)
MNGNKNMMVQQNEDVIDTRTYICGLEASKCIRIMCVLLLVVGSISAGFFIYTPQVITYQHVLHAFKHLNHCPLVSQSTLGFVV